MSATAQKKDKEMQLLSKQVSKTFHSCCFTSKKVMFPLFQNLFEMISYAMVLYYPKLNRYL